MMKLDAPLTLVLGTGQTHSVSDFYNYACGYMGIVPAEYLHRSPDYLRPDEVNWLEANSHLARRTLDWHPKVLFPELVERMVAHDYSLALKEKG
jgi:GDPmannose 4,6-dehydratase